MTSCPLTSLPIWSGQTHDFEPRLRYRTALIGDKGGKSTATEAYYTPQRASMSAMEKARNDQFLASSRSGMSWMDGAMGRGKHKGRTDLSGATKASTSQSGTGIAYSIIMAHVGVVVLGWFAITGYKTATGR